MSDNFPPSTTYIKVKTSFEALHQYPMAPDVVDDLKALHRHIFHVSLQVQVFHDDREIEFFIAKHDVEKAIKAITRGMKRKDGVPVLGMFSCEMIAKAVYKKLEKKYQFDIRDVIITVSEDGNNEAILHVPLLFSEHDPF